MDPKKNPQADLERKSSVFFMLGMAIALVLVITVLQFQKQKTTLIPKAGPIEASLGQDVPITIRPTPEQAKVVAPNKKDINPLLKPIEMPDDIELEIEDLLFKNETHGDEELKEVGLEDFAGKDEVETVDFILIEKMARPVHCAPLHTVKEQKECLNEWIQAYLGQHLKYPETAQRMRLEDRVYVTFIISEKGEVESATIGRGAYEVLNEEALRVVRAMPHFVPGSQRGKAVKMKMTIPVNFKLSSF